jgi:hypothetical protein
LLQRLAVDRLREAGAAIVDQDDVAALPQRPKNAVREPLAPRLRRRDAGASEGREDRAVGRRGLVGVGEDGEEDADLGATRTITVERHEDTPAQRAGHLVARL